MSSFNLTRIFLLVTPVPFFFFLANLLRRLLAEQQYLGEKLKFKKFMIPYFELVEKGKILQLFGFLAFSLLALQSLGFLLVRSSEFFQAFQEKKPNGQNRN